MAADYMPSPWRSPITQPTTPPTNSKGESIPRGIKIYSPNIPINKEKGIVNECRLKFIAKGNQHLSWLHSFKRLRITRYIRSYIYSLKEKKDPLDQVKIPD